MSIERLIARSLAPLARRVANATSRGVVSVVNAGLKMQGLQVRLLAGEVKDGLEHAEPYGFTAHPHPGAEAVVLFLAGDRSHGVVLTTPDRRYRIASLAAGEVAVYDDLGQFVKLGRNGITIHTDQTLRLEGRDIQIHATNSFRHDVNGHGQHWFPTRVDPWTTGATAGTPHPITPPEIS